jgi:hypothetical protein
MARVEAFCSSNVAKLLLTVFIVVALVLGVGVWVFYSPGHGTLIQQPKGGSVPSQ